MSGVYIKNMEMPQSCYACMFFAQTAYWDNEDESDTLSHCKRTGEKTWESVNGYLPNCPLIPVPDHGRLGDLDALVDREYGNLKYYDPECEAAKRERELIVALQTAPTIIPADVTDIRVGNICSGRGKPLPYEG